MSPIYLSHVSFCPNVGNHCSTLFEILAAPPSKNLQNIDFEKIGRANLFHSYNQQKLSSSHLLKQNVIKRCVLKNHGFPGNRYDQTSDKNLIFDDGSRHSNVREFRLSNVNNILKLVNHVKIVILKTAEVHSLPAISDLKVFGRVSMLYKDYNISDKIVEELYTNWEKMKQKLDSCKTSNSPGLISFFESKPVHINSYAHKHQNSLTCHKDNKTESQSSKEILSAPKEFLDSLTLSLMDVPMVLPCGQFIDRKTLNKYNESEASFGRNPNDPFTNLPFTETSRPIFDGKLKTRIDEYVLSKNGISIKELREKRKLESIDSSILNNKPGCDKISQNCATSSKPRAFNDNSEGSSRQYSIKGKDQPMSKLDEVCRQVLIGTKPIINNDAAHVSLSETHIRNQKINSVAGKSNEKLEKFVRVKQRRKNNQVQCCKCLKTKSPPRCFQSNFKAKKPENKGNKIHNPWYQIEICNHVLCRVCIDSISFNDGKGKLQTLYQP